MPVPGNLYLLFTPDGCRRDPVTTLERALDGGVDMVQWRAPATDRQLFRDCRALCTARGVPFLINDDVMLAVRSAAAGAHVGQADMPADAARKLLFGRLLGVSTHDSAQITAAAEAGADYVGFGPCYPTATKGYELGLGAAAIAAAAEHCAQLALPMFAIGGITADNIAALGALGVSRVAVSSFVLTADDPTRAAKRLRATLREAQL